MLNIHMAIEHHFDEQLGLIGGCGVAQESFDVVQAIKIAPKAFGRRDGKDSLEFLRRFSNCIGTPVYNGVACHARRCDGATSFAQPQNSLEPQQNDFVASLKGKDSINGLLQVLIARLPGRGFSHPPQTREFGFSVSCRRCLFQQISDTRTNGVTDEGLAKAFAFGGSNGS